MSIRRFYKAIMRPGLIRGHEPDWLRRHSRRRYIRAVVLSTPPWVDQQALDRLHELKRFLTICTGVEHVLDHIVPLNHPDVCGLTVPWNLRVMTRAQNAAKSGKWNPNQLELDLG